MNIFSLAAIAVITSVLALTFSVSNPQTSILISVCGGSIILFCALPYIAPLISLVQTIAENGSVNSAYISAALKAAGLGMAVSVCSSICCDAGQTAIAKKLEIAGRIAILTVAIPVISAILESIISVLK